MSQETTQQGGLFANQPQRNEEIDLFSKFVDSSNAEHPADVPGKGANVVMVQTPEQKEMSPLEEELKRQKEASTGAVFTSEEIEEGNASVSAKKNFSTNDERMERLEKSISEMDEMIEKRQCVTILKKELNEEEYIQLVNEISSITILEDGTPTFDNYKDSKGNKIIPQLCRLRTPEDGAWDGESQTPEIKQEEKSEEEVALDRTVQIIIDKTGMGADIVFTEEEREKIDAAESIKLIEVEFKDIESIKSSKSTANIQTLANTYQIANGSVPISFPASGFRAHMTPMSYGELSDVALDISTVTVDQYWKRLSVIYNHIVNPTCGRFESFEDFLQKFAYTDIPLAIYGLMSATFPDINEVQLRCGKKGCERLYSWKYAVQPLLQLKRCTDKFLERIEKLAIATMDEFKALAEESPARKSKFVKLPSSGYVIEFGIVSADQYLNNIIPCLNPEILTEMIGDVPEQYLINAFLLPSIRAIHIPDGNGNWIHATTLKDLLEAIYRVGPSDIRIITTLSSKLMEQYAPVFGIENVDCPYCKTHSKFIELDVDTLVFQMYLHLLNTTIDVENILDL